MSTIGDFMDKSRSNLKNTFGGVGDIIRGNSKNATPNPYEDQITQMAQEYYKSTEPLRSNFLNQYENLMTGNFDPQKSPMYQPLFAQGKQGIEGQYGVAKENILSNLPQGGSMDKALADLEMNRASQASMLPVNISRDLIGDMLQKAYGSAFNAPQQAMGGLSNVASSFGQRQGMEQQLKSAAEQKMLESAAYAFGSLIGGA